MRSSAPRPALEVAVVRELGLSRTAPPIAGHKEVTTRKPGDPGHDMAARRREIAALLAGEPGVIGSVAAGVEGWPLGPRVFFGPEDDAHTISGQRLFLADGVTHGHPVLLRWQAAAGASMAKHGSGQCRAACSGRRSTVRRR